MSSEYSSFLFVGLGNPGRQYLQTRHNIGFRILDAFAAQHQCSFELGRGSYWISKCSLKNSTVHLLKPTTYMNNSGLAIKEYLMEVNISLSNLLIVYDDIHLPLGTLRIRQRGSDGGHNGVASIIYHLQTLAFPRIRFGIAPHNRSIVSEQLYEFVLSPFEKEEEPIVEMVIEKSIEAMVSFVEHGCTVTMNRYNRNFLSYN
ncbi:MAG: aminoacyl-tRNA hydrolase [Bacteroidetes bacterium]|nr:aminoacyl-tRNA hydrolase [Bacteroidota bacterium]